MRQARLGLRRLPTVVAGAGRDRAAMERSVPPRRSAQGPLLPTRCSPLPSLTAFVAYRCLSFAERPAQVAQGLLAGLAARDADLKAAKSTVPLEATGLPSLPGLNATQCNQ